MTSGATWPALLDPRDPFADVASPAIAGGSPRGAASGAARHARTPPERADRVPSLEDLARVAIDIAPAAGNEAPDRVLGPWADDLDLHTPAGRRAALVAVAAACFFPPDDEDALAATGERQVGALPPWQRWSRQGPTPPVAERARFRAVARAPWALWRVTGAHGGLALADATGLHPRFVPDRPVAVDTHGALVEPVGGGLLARIVPLTDGSWACALALALPAVAPPALVRRWVAEVVGLAGGAPIEDALARRGHVFVRRACEHAWITSPGDATPR